MTVGGEKINSSPAKDPFLIHSDGEIVYASESCLRLLQSESPDEVVGNSIFEFFDSGYHDELKEQFEEINDGNAPALGLNTELKPLNQDSQSIIVMTSPVEWNGEQKLQSTLIDIAGELSAEPIFRRAMNAAPVGITIADATSEDEPLIYVSDEFVELTGYSEQEALGQNCRFLQGEETSEERVATMRAAIDAEEPVTVTLRNYRKDGTMFWNRVTITPVTDTSGAVTHLLGYQEDVSEMKMYEQEKNLFKKQAEAAPYAMFITDQNGVIEYVNPAFERMTGYSASEAHGQNPRILKSNTEDDSFYENLWETITAGDVWEAELVNQKKSGELYRVHQIIVPIENEMEEITHFACLERDISDTVFTEQVLNVVNRILRHNLRTSINVIDGYTDILKEDLSEADRLAAVEAISERTRQLEKISEKSTNIRKLFKSDNKSDVTSVPEIADYIYNCQQKFADATITYSIETDDDVAIENGSLVQLALEEAIENAVLHNDEGRSRVEITVTQVANPAEIIIDIEDNGTGIPQDEWNVITSDQETPLDHGSGIGLWLIYWCITTLGGDVTMSRQGSYGSVLTCRLPVINKNSDNTS